MGNHTYIIATIKDWNIRNFALMGQQVKANLHLITNKEELSLEKIKPLSPRYIFFPHWSWMIPKKIYSNYECVGFHMTDLPFGRGGSPLQNLITRGIYETKISAVRVIRELDAGPIYLKRDLCLYGSAEGIYIRASHIIFDMIRCIIENEPTPTEQESGLVMFKRRTPAESRIPDVPDLNKVFDIIRMLDAEGYPRAFIKTGNLRFEFSRASLKSGYIRADVKIVLGDNQGE